MLSTLPRLASAVMLLVLVAATSAGCSFAGEQGYTATGVLLVDPGPNASAAELDEAGAAAMRYAEQIRSLPLARAVIERLGLEEDAKSLMGQVSTTASRDDLTLQLTVRHDDPSTAREIAVTLGDAMIEQVVSELSEDEPVEAELAGVVMMIERRWASRSREQPTDLIEPEYPPAMLRYRLVWLEKPRRVTGD